MAASDAWWIGVAGGSWRAGASTAVVVPPPSVLLLSLTKGPSLERYAGWWPGVPLMKPANRLAHRQGGGTSVGTRIHSGLRSTGEDAHSRLESGDCDPPDLEAVSLCTA